MKTGQKYQELGEVCNVINGLWTGKKEPFVNIAVIRNTNFSKDCRLKLDDVAYIDVESKQFKTRKLEVGDIIIEKSGGSEKQPVGRAVMFDIPDGDFSFSNFTAALRVKDKSYINPKFLHKCLLGHYLKGETLKMQSKTTGLHNLDMKAYLKLPVPALSLTEQERIVAELDLLTGIIDKQKAQLKELDTLAQSIFYDMFGDPVENEKGWELKNLCDIGEIIAGSTPSTNDESNWDGNVNWVTPAELGVQMYYGETERKITDKAAKSLTIMPVGTVLLSSRAPIGKLAITSVPMCCNQGFKNIICGKNMKNIFLYYFLMLTMDNIKALGRGATFKEVSKQAISSYKVIVPPLPLQESFAQKIQSIESQKESINRSIAETQKLFDYTMDKYFG